MSENLIEESFECFHLFFCAKLRREVRKIPPKSNMSVIVTVAGLTPDFIAALLLRIYI